MDRQGTVYVVTQGVYSEYHIVEVFSNKSAADKFADHLRKVSHWYGGDSVSVEEYELADESHNVLVDFPDEVHLVVTYWHDTETADIVVVDGIPESRSPMSSTTVSGRRWTELYLPVSILPETSGLKVGDDVPKSDKLMKIIRDRMAHIYWNEVSEDDC